MAKISHEVIFNLEKELDLREKVEEMVDHEDRYWNQKKRLFHAKTKLPLRTIEIIGKEKFIKLLGSNKKDW